jgi:hypothetical protein
MGKSNESRFENMNTSLHYNAFHLRPGVDAALQLAYALPVPSKGLLAVQTSIP